MKKLVGLVGLVLFAGTVAATPEEDHADAIRALGVTNIVVKNPGYFFYGGEYIPPPYVVTREGDFLKINGRYIRFFCKWPPPKLRKWHVTHKMPEVPSSVTEKTTELDSAVQQYWDDCFDYWLTTHSEEDKSLGAAIIVAGMRKLPCVKDAFIDEYGEAQIVWTAGQYTNGCDFAEIADNPSCWNPPPVDSNAIRIRGDNEAVGLAEQISDGNYLFWPLKNGGPWLTGSNLEPEFDKVLKNINKCATAEELSTACGWYPYRVELCADILKHTDSFDAGLRKRINARVAEIEAEKRAEREQEEREAAERKRAAEEYARRKAADRGQGIIERYHADDWYGKSRVCYSCLVKEWPEQLPVPLQAVSHERMDFASYKKELFFLADSENSNRVSRLEVHLAKSVKAAHRSMLTYFSTCAAPQPFPEATEQTGRVGDRCYFGFGETWTSVMFVRNNVFVVLSSSGASFSVRKEAEVIDKEILRLSSVSNNCCNSVSFGDAADFEAELSSRGLSWIKESIDKGVTAPKSNLSTSRDGRDTISGRLYVPCTPGGTNIMRKVVVKDGPRSSERRNEGGVGKED